MEGSKAAAETANMHVPISPARARAGEVRGSLNGMPPECAERCMTALRRWFGFSALRPLQAEAIAAGVAGRDSLVVLPTGGGKSLCYQIPPLVTERLDVVVSPLISLMKDQVDMLRAIGYPAATMHSQMDDAAQREVMEALGAGALRLLFVSPERLLQGRLINLLRRAQVRAIAVDEAHCISQWGHDFRPEYRRLSDIRRHFPEASIHAFTATATPGVRDDIAAQLQLRTPSIIVGSSDRPNLVLRVMQQRRRREMISEVVNRHRGEPGIIYCMSRRETEKITQWLRADGVAAGCYHASLPACERRRTHEAFAREELDVVVATVAFGMGIHRSDVRFVMHTSMPKSIEQYQQEVGRAGRDGLEAECVLLFGGDEVPAWRRLLRSADRPPGALPFDMQMEQVHAMARFCLAAECRHELLRRHFGMVDEDADRASAEAHEGARSCGACDVCLGETRPMPGSQVVVQKILSCAARMGQAYGAKRIADVVRGVRSGACTESGHDRLSTFGLLRDLDATTVRACIRQLIGLGLLVPSDDDRPVLYLGAQARKVLRGEQEVMLLDPRRMLTHRSRAEEESWAGVDRALYERLRGVRRFLAEQEGRRQPSRIFSDASLRDIARRKPASATELRACHGVGEVHVDRYGPLLLEILSGAHRSPMSSAAGVPGPS